MFKKKNDDEKPKKIHVIHPTHAETLNIKASQAPTLAVEFEEKHSHIPIANPKYTVDGVTPVGKMEVIKTHKRL
jgi:hypothetical protein